MKKKKDRKSLKIERFLKVKIPLLKKELEEWLKNNTNWEGRLSVTELSYEPEVYITFGLTTEQYKHRKLEYGVVRIKEEEAQMVADFVAEIVEKNKMNALLVPGPKPNTYLLYKLTILF